MSSPQDPAAAGALAFADDPGARRSKWISAGAALALAGWLGSGYIFPAPEPVEPGPARAVQPALVSVQDSRARIITRAFVAEGQVEPDRRIMLRAEAGGRVSRVLARKGQMVNSGDILAELATEDLEARLAQAREDLSRLRREQENAHALLGSGVVTLDRARDADAAVAGAEAALAAAEKAREAAVLRAPAKGRLHAFDVDEGGVVSAGGTVGTVLDIDPLRVVIQVPQQDRAKIAAGQPAQVSLVTGQVLEGLVDHVSSDAEPGTRTFRTEILVSNPAGDIPSGLSAEVRIPTDRLQAHFISPAILSLDAAGELGVKTVSEGGLVQFRPVHIEQAERDGIWISGLEDSARIVTLGQGFVEDGAPVRIHQEPDSGLPRVAAAGEGLSR